MEDVTFDGYIDLLLPNQQTASAVWYHAFVWGTETGGLVYAPGFSELSDVTLDTARKQVLSHRIQSGVESYAISVYDAEKRDFVPLRSLYRDFSGDGDTVFREFDENGKVVRELYFSGTDPDPESEDFASYFEEGSFWELNSEKWNG